MTGEDFFAHATLTLDGNSTAETDAALGALIHLFLRATFDSTDGCWMGRDEHDTLRRTCHAVEVLHRLNLDSDTAFLIGEATNWLINMPFHDHIVSSEHTRARLYPSRFKTLAYVGRFDDDLVRRDFAELLAKEVGGMIRGVTESDVLTTCIALDTLLTLERRGERTAVCSDERYYAIVAALGAQIRQWRPPDAPTRARRVTHAPETGVTRARRRSGPLTEIDGPRDLSYVLGLLLVADPTNLTQRQLDTVTDYLARSVERRDRVRGADLVQSLYAALQLAEHCREETTVESAVEGLLRELRTTYATPDGPRRWDLGTHTLVLRLLLNFRGDAPLTRGIVSHFLRQAERRRTVEQSTLETELKQVIRERLEIAFGEITELSGGFTGDQVFRVPFTYWYPVPGARSDAHFVAAQLETSIIIKRSTSDAFLAATENYLQLPPSLRGLFVRQPSESQVHKSGLSSAYYLTMEDLANLSTLASLMNEWDQRAMSDLHARLLRSAAELVCDASFTLFRETLGGRSAMPGTQIAHLYLSQIEGKLARAVLRVPWLKNPLQGYIAAEQRFKGLDYYLTLVAKHSATLQPRALGLTHGDLHAGNVMLDRACNQLKLIDLDKLSWTGDYLADLGNLLTDLCVYRRVAEQQRQFGLPREEVVFVSRSSEPGTAENVVRYPALGRPATLAFQRHMLQSIERFADEIDDRGWKPRLWLASAAAMLKRVAFETQKEPAAVLYGEGIRLLHELTRFLEGSADLPELPVPAAWPQPALGRATATAIPAWVEQHPVLIQVHDRLRQLGLRPEYDHSSISYHAAAEGDGPLLKLVPPRREGVARLLLPAGGAVTDLGASLKIVGSSHEGDALGTIVIVLQTTNPNDVVAAVQTSLAGRAALARVRR